MIIITTYVIINLFPIDLLIMFCYFVRIYTGCPMKYTPGIILYNFAIFVPEKYRP